MRESLQSYLQKSFLFATVATQRQRSRYLSDPVSSFEISWLVRLTIYLTITVNKWIYSLLHTKEAEGMNWNTYFDDPQNCYIQFRWLADKRTLIWLLFFYLFCHFVYWVGMNLYKSLFLLMRISGVVSKYKTSLLSGIIKLFCIDSYEIHTFFKTILAKWPYGSSKRVIDDSWRE